MYDLLTKIYERYNRTKLRQVSYILEEYKGQEIALLRNLCERYNMSEYDVQAFVDMSAKVQSHRLLSSSQSTKTLYAHQSPVVAKVGPLRVQRAFSGFDEELYRSLVQAEERLRERVSQRFGGSIDHHGPGQSTQNQPLLQRSSNPEEDDEQEEEDEEEDDEEEEIHYPVSRPALPQLSYQRGAASREDAHSQHSSPQPRRRIRDRWMQEFPSLRRGEEERNFVEASGAASHQAYRSGTNSFASQSLSAVYEPTEGSIPLTGRRRRKAEQPGPFTDREARAHDRPQPGADGIHLG